MAETRRQIRTSVHTANLPGPPEAQGIGSKWPQARTWCERTTQQGLHPPGERQAQPDPSQGGEANVLEVLPAQVRALTGVYLKSTKNRPDDHYWWCDPENHNGTHQTRDHLSKHCYERPTGRESRR